MIITCINCNSLINNPLILKNINVCPFCYEILNINNNKNYNEYDNMLDNILSHNIIKQLTCELDKDNKNYIYYLIIIILNFCILFIYIIFL